MKRRVVVLLVLAVLFTLVFTGTALGWSHAKGAAPILDHYTVVSGPPISSSWVWVELYWSPDGAKPAYACYAREDGTSMTAIRHSDLVAGYKMIMVPRVATAVYLETRKGIKSNVLTFTLP